MTKDLAFEYAALSCVSGVSGSNSVVHQIGFVLVLRKFTFSFSFKAMSVCLAMAVGLPNSICEAKDLGDLDHAHETNHHDNIDGDDQASHSDAQHSHEHRHSPDEAPHSHEHQHGAQSQSDTKIAHSAVAYIVIPVPVFVVENEVGRGISCQGFFEQILRPPIA